jgi:hypothetical protein
MSNSPLEDSLFEDRPIGIKLTVDCSLKDNPTVDSSLGDSPPEVFISEDKLAEESPSGDSGPLVKRTPGDRLSEEMLLNKLA